jgi:GT2 family glycosyltransferase
LSVGIGYYNTTFYELKRAKNLLEGREESFMNEARENPLASVIIVTYNGLSHLKECLDSLRLQTLKNFEAVLVDNASTDGSVAFVKENYPEVRVIENRENLGYGGGNNCGISQARGRYVVLLNNDTKVDARWLERLCEAAEKDRTIGMCASKILDYYNPEIIDNTGLLIYRDGVARGRGRLERDAGQYSLREEVLLPSGCAGLYRREMLDEIGLFDEDFFLYVDDVDIGFRGRLAGWRCMYVPEAVVYHKYSATTEPYSPLKAYLVERNRIWVVMKCFPLRIAVASLFYTLLRYIMQAYGIVTGKGAGSRLVRSGSGFGSVLILLRAYLSAFRKFGIMVGNAGTSWGQKSRQREISLWFRRFGIGARELALKDV